MVQTGENRVAETRRPNKVLATGGGVILSPVNRNRMKSSGIVVALTANLETIWNRLKDSSTVPLEENNL